MAVYFEGTSTGNRYEVGRTYEMGGREYTAQADGSFVREGSRTSFTTDEGRTVRENDGGHVVAGSSQDPSVRWYASGGESLTSAGYAPGSAVSLSGSGSPQAVAAATSGVVEMAAPTARFRAAAADYLRTAAWSGKDDPGQDNLLFGFHLQANPRTTNAELFEARYGDFGSSVIGIGVLADDLWYSGTRHLSNPRTQRAAADAAVSVGADVLGGMMAGWDTLRSATQAQLNVEAATTRNFVELQDAYDARDRLVYEESRKRADRYPEHMSPALMGIPDSTWWIGATR